MTDAVVVLPAGGTSSRFGKENKLVCDLCGMPVFCHSVKLYLKLLPADRIAMAVNQDFREKFEEALRLFFPNKKFRIVEGGKNRTESVLHALELFEDLKPRYAAVHDAARPLLTIELAEETFRQCRIHGAAVAVHRIHDTVKKIGPDSLLYSDSIDREQLRGIETPQIFLYDELLNATERAVCDQLSFTDDAAAVEHYIGRKAYAVENAGFNLKITRGPDLALARLIMEMRSREKSV